MQHIIMLSLLIAVILVIRALLRKHISPCVMYALWLLAVLKLCVPVSLFDIEIIKEKVNEAPIKAEEQTADMAYFPENDGLYFSNVKDESSENNGDVIFPTAGTDEIDRNEIETDNDKTVENTASVIEQSPSSLNAAQKKAQTISPKIIFAFLWLIGAEIVAVWFISSSLIFTFGVHRDRRMIGKYKGVRVYISEKARTPCLHGIIPAIYLTPKSDASHERELVLCHEYTHLLHGDNLWSIVRMAALILLWWNPLVWAAALFSKQDGEIACDYVVTKRLDEGRKKDYAHMIIDMIPKKRTAATGFSNNSIKERIIMMTKRQKNRIFTTLIAIFIAVLAASCSFIGVKETVKGTDVLPSVDKADFETVSLYRYDGENMQCVTFEDETSADELIGALSVDTLEEVEDFKHSMIKGDIYGLRITDESSSAYAWTNGYLITDSGKAYKYEKDIAKTADRYFTEEIEKERLSKFFPCLYYIALDGDEWDLDYMPRKSSSQRNYQYSEKAYEAKIERFFGENIELYTLAEDGSIVTTPKIFASYDMQVLLDAKWYDVPINEFDYEEIENIVYSQRAGEAYSQKIIREEKATYVDIGIEGSSLPLGRYTVKVPLETPSGYYKLSVLGTELTFSVSMEERQRIVTQDEVDFEAVDAQIMALIPSIAPEVTVGDGFSASSYWLGGMEKEDGILTVYILANYCEFSFDGTLKNDVFRTFPAILKFRENDGGYSLEEYLAARRWSDLEYDMPEGVWQFIYNGASDSTDMVREAYKKACEHYGFDPSSLVEEKIDAYLLANEELENTDFGDEKYPSLYNAVNSIHAEVLHYGEYTMKYICEQIMAGREMMGAYGEYIRKLLTELTKYYHTSEASLAEYFFAAYRDAWTMREDNAELLKEHFPMMYVITECIGKNALQNPNKVSSNVIKGYLITSDAEHLFSYTDKNKGVALEFYSSLEDPKKFKVGYYDGEGDLMPSFGNNIVGSYSYDSAVPIFAGCEGLELFYILKMTDGDEVYYLKFISSLAAKHNGVIYPHFGFAGEISEEEVNRLLKEQKG